MYAYLSVIVIGILHTFEKDCHSRSVKYILKLPKTVRFNYKKHTLGSFYLLQTFMVFEMYSDHVVALILKV